MLDRLGFYTHEVFQLNVRRHQGLGCYYKKVRDVARFRLSFRLVNYATTTIPYLLIVFLVEVPQATDMHFPGL